MTALQLATVITEVYYAGKVKESAMRLEVEDFVQLVQISAIDALKEAYKEERMQGTMSNSLADMTQTFELDISLDKYGRTVALFPKNLSVMTLPDSAGVQSVQPLAEGGYCRGIVRGVAGSEWLFCGKADYPVFIAYDKFIQFINLPDCVKKVLANLVAIGPDSPISDEVAWFVAKDIWRQVSRTIALPIDKVIDWNPNQQQILQTKLSSPQVNG